MFSFFMDVWSYGLMAMTADFLGSIPSKTICLYSLVVEHHTCNVKVKGSNPFGGKYYPNIA